MNNEKNTSDATPTRRAKRASNLYKNNNTNGSSATKIVQAGLSPGNDCNKTANSAELLHAMTEIDESDNESIRAKAGGANKASVDNSVSQVAKSPVKQMVENNAFLESLHIDDEGLSLASFNTPVPIYQYLANIYPNKLERQEKLSEIFLALGLENAYEELA
jgi:hypothetical protein